MLIDLIHTPNNGTDLTPYFQGCDSSTSSQEDMMSPVVTREVVDCGDHSEAMLAGLHRLRQAGLLLDTLLWAEGVSFQVSTSNIRQRIIIHDLVHWMTLEDFSKLCVNAKGN